jgi:hypothetical protein
MERAYFVVRRLSVPDVLNMLLKHYLDIGTERTSIFSASFSRLAFKAGLTLKFICAMRDIVRSRIGSRDDTMYYKGNAVREVTRGYSYYKLCNLLGIRWKFRFSDSRLLRNGI